MKKLFGRILCLCLALIAFISIRLGAQEVTDFPDISTLTADNLFNALYEPLYSALIIVFGYVSTLVPGLKKFSAFGRVLTFGLVAGLGFHLFGGASIWKVGLSFLISTGLIYDGFLKPFVGLIQKPKAAG